MNDIVTTFYLALMLIYLIFRSYTNHKLHTTLKYVLSEGCLEEIADYDKAAHYTTVFTHCMFHIMVCNKEYLYISIKLYNRIITFKIKI